MCVYSCINTHWCARELLRPKFRDAVEREVRQFAVEHSQLGAALQTKARRFARWWRFLS